MTIKNNLLDFWSTLASSEQDWKILKKDDLTCLKPSIKFKYLNLAWGIRTLEALKEAQNFFQKNDFIIYSEENVLDNHLLKMDQEVEMQLSLDDFSAQALQKNVKISKVKTEEDFEKFINISAQIFLIPKSDFYQFLYPARHITPMFLAWCDDKPVGTSQFFKDMYQFAGLQTIGVIEELRRRGIGRALTEACLVEAKFQGCIGAGLCAS
ncbi:MAG: hypothetical protein BGO77_03035 [Caedibacter sp. 37-49]|nr:MAG: hypothetical protein BGO77_03035 [Caedibacter sp. 37-49]